MIYYRITPEGKFLKKEDYKVLQDGKIHGFGLSSTHYNQVHKARIQYNILHPDNPLPLREDFKEDWDVRTGFNIENKPFNTRYHPYHDLRLFEKETGKIYVVDSVHKHHYFGYYIMLLAREEGSKSHASIIWENISCQDPTTLEALQEAKDRFEVL